MCFLSKHFINSLITYHVLFTIKAEAVLREQTGQALGSRDIKAGIKVATYAPVQSGQILHMTQ
jgi:hypothetical protein